MTPPAGREPTPPLAFPGGRVLAGWWRQLAQEPSGPVRAVWFGHLLLHRVESLFEVEAVTPIALLDRLLLRALALAPARTAAELDAALHLGSSVLHRLLGGLHAVGLAEPVGGGRWVVTELGVQVQGQNGLARTERQRRVLHFVEDRPAGDR